MLEVVLTPAAGKRLIAKALQQHPLVQAALAQGTIVIVAGTTNGYVAEELLRTRGQSDGFERKYFFRGITLPPTKVTTAQGRVPNETKFPGDVVLVKGEWLRGKTIFDVVDDLGEGDVILKGGNALDLLTRQAAVFVGHPKGGTIGAIIPAVIGRRVKLLVPIGLEKRIVGNLHTLALQVNTGQSKGPRLMPMPGEVFTELDALRLLTGAEAELIGSGGVGGAEGSVWLAVRGSETQEQQAEQLLEEVKNEPTFQIEDEK